MLKKVKIGANMNLVGVDLDVGEFVKAKAKYIELGTDACTLTENMRSKLPDVRVKIKAHANVFGYNFFLAFHPEAPWQSTLVEGVQGDDIFKDFPVKKVKDNLPYLVRIYELESTIN